MATATPSTTRSQGERPRQGRGGLTLLLATLAVLLVAFVGPMPNASAARPLPPIGPGQPPVLQPPPTPPPTPPTTPPTTPPPTVPPVVPPTVPPVLDPGDGPPNPECDAAGGFARPTGTIPPGYIYSPTSFDGAVRDPQPDDTFAADAAGHAPYVGHLRTRVVNGVEQLLVCAHVGTNVPDDALTPFPLPGPGGHGATIGAQVILMDAAGASTTYRSGSPGTAASLTHYAGSTDPHQALLQMWVPFTPSLHEPGFTVRVEVRGTPALPGGGTTQVMGADEVFVHLGPAPLFRGNRADQALGIALDDSAIGERPEDPGADDISSLIHTQVEQLIAQRIEGLAPADIPSDWDWSPGVAFGTAAGGTLNSLDTFVHSFTLDVENFNATEGRGVITFQGTARPKMTLHPRSVGFVSVASGSCEVESLVTFQARASFTVNLTPDGTRPTVDIGFVQASGTVNFVNSHGDLWVFYGPFPLPTNCSLIEDDIEGGVVEQVNEKLRTLENDAALKTDMETELNTRLRVADLTNSPLSSANITLPGGVGFVLNSPRYVPTAPPGHIGGDVFITADGADVAGGVLVSDQGGARFQYSYVPSQQQTLVQSTYGRTRPSGTASFDVGLIVSGATVNQLSRAVTAGRPVSIVAPPPCCIAQAARLNPAQLSTDVGLLDINSKVDVDGNGTPDLDVAVFPSVPPLYLPTPPAGWPAPGNADLLIPSLRIAIPVPGIATMATDVRVGLNASIDSTNHLVPTVQSSAVSARFLRLGPTTNVVPDPATTPTGIVAIATNKIQEVVPDTVAQVLRPITIPDLSTGAGGLQVHLANLTVGTVGGGHLGAFVDVLPGPPPPPPPTVVTTWAAGSSGSPTSFTANLIPAGLPGTGDYNVHWTVTDASNGSVIYLSPTAGEAATTKTLSAAGLGISTDSCTGEHSVSVSVSAVVTRAGHSETDSGSSGFTWAGTPPTHPPAGCQPPPDPNPDPDPEDPPIPPVCIHKPWLCDDF